MKQVRASKQKKSIMNTSFWHYDVLRTLPTIELHFPPGQNNRERLGAYVKLLNQGDDREAPFVREHLANKCMMRILDKDGKKRRNPYNRVRLRFEPTVDPKLLQRWCDRWSQPDNKSGRPRRFARVLKPVRRDRAMEMQAAAQQRAGSEILIYVQPPDKGDMGILPDKEDAQGSQPVKDNVRIMGVRDLRITDIKQALAAASHESNAVKQLQHAPLGPTKQAMIVRCKNTDVAKALVEVGTVDCKGTTLCCREWESRARTAALQYCAYCGEWAFGNRHRECHAKRLQAPVPMGDRGTSCRCS